MAYSSAFESALNHAMLYEVGGFWNVNHPAVTQGLIDTPDNRRAVGYVNDPTDRGGETKFGVAGNANKDLNIRLLTWEQAKAVYYSKYWLAGGCDKLNARVAVLHFDGCVNHGINRAGVFLQVVAGTKPDGAVGPATAAKVNSLDPFAVCAGVCSQREQFYRQIVANNPPQVKYLAGWLRRINEMRTFVLDKSKSF